MPYITSTQCSTGSLGATEFLPNCVFGSPDKINVRMVSFGGSSNNISLLVDTPQKENSLKALNAGLFGLKE